MSGETETPTFEEVNNTSENIELSCEDGICKIKPTDEDLPFSRKAIEKLSTKIRLVDSDAENGLDLFCYIKCTDSDPKIIKECRGAVFHEDKLIAKSFNYTPEYCEGDGEQVEELLKDNFDQCYFFDSHEGALIRVFYFNKWYISTHRRLDAFRSKWASRKSFGSMFEEALESEDELTNPEFSKWVKGEHEKVVDNFLDKLDKKKQYMFLVRNTTENRIVCNAPKRPTVYHVGTFEEEKFSFESDLHLQVPYKHSFKSVRNIFNYVYDVNPAELQGVIIFAPDNQQYKILNGEYSYLFNIRGNEPSVKFRYLQIRMNQDYVDRLYCLYPRYVEDFDEYENIIFEIARYINTAYIQRFIKKKYITVPQEEFKVMKVCHEWHRSDKDNNRISFTKVQEILNKQEPTDLNRMIKRIKNEKLKKFQNQRLLKKESYATEEVGVHFTRRH